MSDVRVVPFKGSKIENPKYKFNKSIIFIYTQESPFYKINIKYIGSNVFEAAKVLSRFNKFVNFFFINFSNLIRPVWITFL